MNAKARGEDPEAAINYLREELIRENEENPPYEMKIEIADETEDFVDSTMSTSKDKFLSKSLSEDFIGNSKMASKGLYVSCA